MNTHKCPTLDEFKSILKKNSLKATPQRLAVHEAMMELGHASADMVTEVIKNKGTAKVTIASVYNILTHMTMLKVYNISEYVILMIVQVDVLECIHVEVHLVVCA